MNFALVGVAGYVAPRHLKAIRDTGNRLVAAADPHDSVGILDQFSFDVRYFPEIERFDRYLYKLQHGAPGNQVHYVTVCSPNYLHDAHIRLGLRLGADVICEKPLVINPWNLDLLQEMERETGKRVYTILQLRVHPALLALKERCAQRPPGSKMDVVLTYVTARGNWYAVSWKGSEERSGGLCTNIGIHLFDLLLWLFGPLHNITVHLRDPQRASGRLELQNANVRWYLSTDIADLADLESHPRRTTFRSITFDGEEIEFTEGFNDLHTRVYERTLQGQGFGIEDARPSIELVHALRTAPITATDGALHPLLCKGRPGQASGLVGSTLSHPGI